MFRNYNDDSIKVMIRFKGNNDTGVIILTFIKITSQYNE